jgi:bifunctional enzyme CysN/CysC
MTASALRKPSLAIVPNVPELVPVARQANSTRDLNGILRLLTCGSVDDGKSTLIGRLLWDASDLYDDQRATIERSGKLAGNSGQPDFSLLVDGLTAEREQGITIDIAWRYFDTERRRFVVIDSPGHEQYTRNMASGASHADVAIMLVDARSGIKKQTRRHAAILDLVGVKRVVLAVNKMDLVDFDEAKFLAIAADFEALTARFGFSECVAIPLAAVTGDNVATRSAKTPWYDGPTLLQHLDALPSRASDLGGPFRMAVQTVLRDGLDFRGLAGTVSSGRVCVGDRIVDALSGQASRVLRIATMGRDLEIAGRGEAVAIQLEDDLDIARGAVISGFGNEPTVATQIEANFVWLWETPFDPAASYLLATSTDTVAISSAVVTSLLNLETLETSPAALCAVNDIGTMRLSLGRAISVDTFTKAPETGCFMIVDALTGTSLAAGVITAATRVVAKPANGPQAASKRFVLTRAMLQDGVCAGLTASVADKSEFDRRARAVMALLQAAGVEVVVDDAALIDDNS